MPNSEQKKEYKITFTQVHEVTLNCKPSDLEYNRNIVGVTLGTHGSRSYSDNKPNHVTDIKMGKTTFEMLLTGECE